MNYSDHPVTGGKAIKKIDLSSLYLYIKIEMKQYSHYLLLINFHRYFAVLRLKRSSAVFVEHGNKGLGHNTQLHVQQAKAFLSNYIHTLGDMMLESNEVRMN